MILPEMSLEYSRTLAVGPLPLHSDSSKRPVPPQLRSTPNSQLVSANARGMRIPVPIDADSTRLH